jgi:hypothetical protein
MDDTSAAPQALTGHLSASLPCLGCGLWVDGRDDYCASCWDDLMDWLGW